MFIDTHAHITAEQFNDDRDDVIRRAQDAGVHVIVNPATDLDDSRRAIALAEKHAGVYACIGFHPHDAWKADDEALREIEEMSKHPKVVAIGEIGLDFHYDFSPREVQRRVFQAQLEIARRCNLPVVIHTRESEDETLALVEQAIATAPDWRNHRAGGRYPGARGVFHCFSGDTAMAWKLIHLGFFISFPGVVTFPNAVRAAEVASAISLEHILLETDSPYLTPHPLRKKEKRNEPKNILPIAEKIALLQHLSVEDVARTTRFGAYKLFGIGEPGPPRFTYTLRNALYINLTIRCNADCVFCDRKGEAMIKGHNLRIEREPSVQEVIDEIGDPTRYDEVVFCGYGEPTIRLEDMKEIARWVKAHGGRTRLNTDGHGNIINKRNIVPELVGLIDAVSISLNSIDPIQYGELMRIDGRTFFPAMLDFAREARRLLPRVIMTIVDMDGIDKEHARQLVEQEIGAEFQARPYF